MREEPAHPAETQQRHEVPVLEDLRGGRHERRTISSTRSPPGSWPLWPEDPVLGGPGAQSGTPYAQPHLAPWTIRWIIDNSFRVKSSKTAAAGHQRVRSSVVERRPMADCVAARKRDQDQANLE